MKIRTIQIIALLSFSGCHHASDEGFDYNYLGTSKAYCTQNIEE